MENREIIQHYYEMWNSKEFDKAEQWLDADIRFRGSLDITANGIEGFKEYAQMITQAFPNLYHAIEMGVYDTNQAAIYVTYSGKHEGHLLGYAPTGKRISYSGASFFHFKNGKIVSINVLGDLNSLHRQLSDDAATF
jgi:steroid delta-isomerase-like uncharacterized protein